MSDVFQGALRFPGIESSPAFVWAPEGKGCSERFIRTLKEQRLWVQGFATVEELRLALQGFRRTYNGQWMVARHDHRSAAEVRRSLLEATALNTDVQLSKKSGGLSRYESSSLTPRKSG